MNQPKKLRELTVRTQAEVGAIMGLSAGRVFQIEKEALAKLRKALQEQREANPDEEPTR